MSTEQVQRATDLMLLSVEEGGNIKHSGFRGSAAESLITPGVMRPRCPRPPTSEKLDTMISEVLHKKD